MVECTFLTNNSGLANPISYKFVSTFSLRLWPHITVDTQYCFRAICRWQCYQLVSLVSDNQRHRLSINYCFQSINVSLKCNNSTFFIGKLVWKDSHYFRLPKFPKKCGELIRSQTFCFNNFGKLMLLNPGYHTQKHRNNSAFFCFCRSVFVVIFNGNFTTLYRMMAFFSLHYHRFLFQ